MSYQETVDWLSRQLPMYQREGKTAFRKDLSNIRALLDALDHPEKKFRSLHVGGTNGKGSIVHMLAAILQESGYKTGIYSSPHLRDFRERVKINGIWMPESFVCEFVKKIKEQIDQIRPSFFEITVAMAFEYFAREQVDVAIIEVGLGGRLDSTNVIAPLLSIISNVSLEHQDMLGSEIGKIAFEKAGIIKKNTPVVIGRHHPESDPVFRQKANEMSAVLYFAEDAYQARVIRHEIDSLELSVKNLMRTCSKNYILPGGAFYQQENLLSVLKAIDLIRTAFPAIHEENIQRGISRFKEITSFEGRWQILKSSAPKILADAAHNGDALNYIFSQLRTLPVKQLHCVMGTVTGKDLDAFFESLDPNAHYYFARPAVPRGLDADLLTDIAQKKGMKAYSFNNANEAYEAALQAATKEDLIFVGGSIFLLSDIFRQFEKESESS